MTAISVNTLEQALSALCGGTKTQSGQHIKPLHMHCSHRLVLEGGFPPEWVHPTPPLASKPERKDRHLLSYSEKAESSSEQSVLGAMKYKNIDITVVVPGVGPALGVSAKSTGNAFRNLTNRMEEAPGDCANVHMMYPGFVFGFLHLIKFATATEVQHPNDASFTADDKPLESIVRYHNALSALTGRTTITDPPMRYEAIGLVVYRCAGGKAEVWPNYPAADSAVHYSRFFQKLYDIYDLRYAYPDSSGRNHRKVWQISPGAVGSKFDEKMGASWGVRFASSTDDLADEG